MKENNVGLVSISFREQSILDILKYSKNAGLKYIEWGSDIHVPKGDLENAKNVYELTKQHGMEICSYGSYYRLGEQEDYQSEFKKYISTAKELHTKIIRIWAGFKSSCDAGKNYCDSIVKEAQEICRIAKENDIIVAFEYHPNTMTDCCTSAIAFMEKINMENCKLYWQPNYKKTQKENLIALKAVIPYLCIVHVFFWDNVYGRLSLCEGKQCWKEYIDIINNENIQPKFLLEFVKDDDITCLKKETECLIEMI